MSRKIMIAKRMRKRPNLESKCSIEEPTTVVDASDELLFTVFDTNDPDPKLPKLKCEQPAAGT